MQASVADIRQLAEPRAGVPQRLNFTPLNRGPLRRLILGAAHSLEHDSKAALQHTANVLEAALADMQQLSNDLHQTTSDLHQTSDTLQQTTADLQATRQSLAQLDAEWRQTHAQAAQQIQELAAALEQSRAQQAQAAHDSAHNVEVMRAQTVRLSERVSALALQQRATVATPTPAADASAAGAPQPVPGDDADFDHFYEAFEAAFRGDPALIRQRQEDYLPLLRAAVPPGAATLDLGCGRGEWLELVQENGWRAEGWDLNGRFIDTCRTRGLQAHHGDALAAVARIAAEAPGSLHVITAFHLVEHIPFQALVTLVDNALLALADGGLLIFETPNPENLSVGANTFYTDPTHQRPLHPATMAFLAQRSGFTQAASWRLTTARGITPLPVPAEGGLLADMAQQLNRHLAVGPDFALVARKGHALPPNVQPQ